MPYDGEIRNIPISRPFLGKEEETAVCDPLRSGWVTQGPQVAAFEEEFAQYTGAKHACAVSSCTTALHLALLAVGVQPGDEVITVSHSFIATANAVRYCGATPVFVDIDPRTFNMDPQCAAKAITPKTKAILCVHQLGMPCDLSAMLTLARQHGLPLVEDAACAIGSEILWDGHWDKIGKPHGDVACFSFHPRKVITTGDGGMLTTNSTDMLQRFRLLRQHGMSVPDTVRHNATQIIIEEYNDLGYNYRLTDIQASIGRVQLTRLPWIVSQRRRLAARYVELLSGIKGLILPYEPDWGRTNWQTFCLRLPDPSSQKNIMQFLKDRGIASKTGVMCAHREHAYKDVDVRHCLIESERAQDGCLLIPLYAQMTEDDQCRVAKTLREALG